METSSPPPPRPAMALGDWVVVVAFAAMALAPLIGLLVRVWTKGGVITGADGFLVLDPMQYVNWLRQSGDFGAAANLYDLAPGPHSFVHPGLGSSIAWGSASFFHIWFGSRSRSRRSSPGRTSSRRASCRGPAIAE